MEDSQYIGCDAALTRKQIMNAHYTNRAKQAIAETARFIAKEESRDSALRSSETQKLLELYKQRHAEMTELLASTVK
jgi:hypothetical protein